MLNTPRRAIRSIVSRGILAALLGTTLGCAGSAPSAPTPQLPTPAPVAPPGVYTVTPSTNIVAPGGQLSVSWTASIEGGNDYIVLFKTNEPNTARGWWFEWTDGATSGTFALAAPLEAGQYEFRYLLDDGYNDAVRSSLVTVRAGAAPTDSQGP